MAESRRSDFGGADRQVGMALFLGSWAMLFATLFFSYGLLRTGAAAWPPLGAPRLPLLAPAANTMLIALSSFLLERRRPGGAAALGSAFLAVQCLVWAGLYREGLTLQSGAYGSVFYTFTVFHALHVAIGAAALALLALRRRPPGLWRAYWHFVGVVWVLLYALVYLP